GQQRGHVGLRNVGAALGHDNDSRDIGYLKTDDTIPIGFLEGSESCPPCPKFSLSLPGAFELTGPGGVIDLPSKKLAGLLAYLARAAPGCRHATLGVAAMEAPTKTRRRGRRV